MSLFCFKSLLYESSQQKLALRGAVHKYLDNADSMQNSAQSEDPRFGAVGESHPFGDKDGVAKGEGAKSADSISYHLEALEESYGAETRVT